MQDQSTITKFVEAEIKGKAKIFKLGFAVDNNLKGKVRVTIVAAGFDLPDIVEEKPIIIPVEEEKDFFIDKPLPGMNVLGGKIEVEPIHIQPKQQPVFVEEQSDYAQIQQMIDAFVRNRYDMQDLNRPAFFRNGTTLLDMKIVKSGDVELYNLQDLYEGLLEEKVL